MTTRLYTAFKPFNLHQKIVLLIIINSKDADCMRDKFVCYKTYCTFVAQKKENYDIKIV